METQSRIAPPSWLQIDTRPVAPAVQVPIPNYVAIDGRAFADIEREIYAHAIRSTRSLRAAARMLGIPRATFHNRVRRMFNAR